MVSPFLYPTKNRIVQNTNHIDRERQDKKQNTDYR